MHGYAYPRKIGAPPDAIIPYNGALRRTVYKALHAEVLHESLSRVQFVSL